MQNNDTRKRACHLLRSSQTMKIMRLTTILLVTFCLHCSAKGFSQKVTLSVHNTSVERVLEEIRKQTGYTFFYKTELLRNVPKISVSVRSVSIKEILNRCFQNLPFTYEIDGKTIVIKGKEMIEKTASLNLIPPPVVLRGKVTNEKGDPLQGASVQVKGTSNGTVTDVDGLFTIHANTGSTLVISYVGYANQEIKVGDENNITIALQVSNSIDTLVVTALGIKKSERATTYNVQTLKNSDVTAVNDANLASALVGKVAGATVNASASGVGGSVRLILRGTKSITGNNNALYVVDGVPLPNLFTSQPGGIFNGADNGEGIANFNPDDIQSISVLSGASAAALYGYEAANGVILITTKKGSTDRTKVNFSSGATFASPFVLPKLQTTYGASASGKNGPSMFSWGAKLTSPSSYSAKDFFQTGTNYTNSINVSTGSDRSQTYFSAGAINATGIIHNNNYSRYNFTIRNTSALIPNKLDLDISAMYLSEKRQNPPGQGEYSNPLVGVYLFPAGDIDSANYTLKNYQVFNPSRNFFTQNWAFGDLGLTAQNPYWIINKQFININRSRFMGTAALRYTINDDLTLTGRVKYDEANDKSETKYYASTTFFITGGDNGSYSYSTANNKQTYADLMLNYKKSLNDFNLNFVLGTSIVDNKFSSVGVGGALGLVPNFFSITNVAQANIGASNTLPQEQQNQAIFGSADIGYKNKLFLTVTGRNDWNSALAYTSAGSIFYPSIGLSGILSDMVKLPKFISYAKLRGSYSEVGNPPAQYLSYPLPGIKNGTLNVVTAAPFNIKPERTKSVEGGVDLKFLKNAVNFSFTYYNTNTINQIFNVSIPAGASQYSSYNINAGKINNYGIEMLLGYSGNFGQLQWTPSATFSLNRNKVLQLLHNAQNPFTGGVSNQDTLYPAGAGTYGQWLTVGGSAGDIYTTGLQKHADGSLVTTTTNQSFPGVTVPVTSDTMRKVGNSNPRYNIGFSNGFAYKGFNLHFTITARIGGQVVSETQAFLDYYGASQTSAQARDKGSITVAGTTFSNPQAYYQTVNLPSGGGLSNIALSQYVYSATNVRLSEVSFGYTLPGSLFKNTIKSVGLSLIGRNLWMIYNKAPYDPELAASTGTFFQGFDFFNQPSQRYIGLKLNVTF